jgi:hypothetical protein
MDLMENSNKWTNDKNKLRNFAPSLCRSKIPQKKKKQNIRIWMQDNICENMNRRCVVQSEGRWFCRCKIIYVRT